MNIIIAILKNFGLYREPTIDSITSPIGKIVDRLNTYAAAQQSLAAANRVNAEALLSESKQAEASATDAFALADRYGDLTMMKIAAE